MGDGRQVDIDTRATHAATRATSRTAIGEQTVVAGRLEKVDLHSHVFRIRDDVGSTMELRSISNDNVAARLIGSRVVARGTAVRNRSRLLIALVDAAIEADEVAASWQIPSVVPIAKPVATAGGPGAAPAVELSDEEFAAFLEAIRS